MSTSNKIKITCDSICDLTPEIYEKYDITVLPLSVTIGDSSYKDGVDITLDKLFEKVSETGALRKPPLFRYMSMRSFSKSSPNRNDGHTHKYIKRLFKLLSKRVLGGRGSRKRLRDRQLKPFVGSGTALHCGGSDGG